MKLIRSFSLSILLLLRMHSLDAFVIHSYNIPQACGKECIGKKKETPSKTNDNAKLSKEEISKEEVFKESLRITSGGTFCKTISYTGNPLSCVRRSGDKQPIVISIVSAQTDDNFIKRSTVNLNCLGAMIQETSSRIVMGLEDDLSEKIDFNTFKTSLNTVKNPTIPLSTSYDIACVTKKYLYLAHKGAGAFLSYFEKRQKHKNPDREKKEQLKFRKINLEKNPLSYLVILSPTLYATLKTLFDNRSSSDIGSNSFKEFVKEKIEPLHSEKNVAKTMIEELQNNGSLEKNTGYAMAVIFFDKENTEEEIVPISKSPDQKLTNQSPRKSTIEKTWDQADAEASKGTLSGPTKAILTVFLLGGTGTLAYATEPFHKIWKKMKNWFNLSANNQPNKKK